MVVTKYERRILNLFGACLLLFASSVPAGAQFSPIDPRKYDNAAHIELEIEKARKAANASEKNVANFEQPLQKAREAIRTIQRKQEPYVKERNQLNKEIQEISTYLFILDLPKISDARVARFKTLLRPLLENADLLKSTTHNYQVPKQLQAEIDYFQGNIEHFKRTKKAALRIRPTLKVPAVVPQGIQPREHLYLLIDQRETRNTYINEYQRQIQTGIERLKVLNRNFRKAQLEAVANRAKNYGLIALINSKYSPPHIAEIKVFASDDLRRRERLYHHAYAEDPPEVEELNKRLKILEENVLPAAMKRVEETLNNFKRSEKNFVAVAKNWLEKNEEYTNILYAQYLLNYELEALDAMFAIAKEGFNPISVLFETGYRTYEAFTSDFRIPEPKINKDIIALRQRISKQLQHPDLVKQEFDTEKLIQSLDNMSAGYIEAARQYRTRSERMADHLSNDQLGELIKGGMGVGWSAYWANLSKEAVRNETILRFINKDRTLKMLFTISALNPNLGTPTLVDIMRQVEKHPNAFNKASRLIRGEIGDVSGTVFHKLKKSILKKEFWEKTGAGIGKDLVIGAAITYGKDLIKEQARKPLYEAATELAIMEVEWLVRRYDFQMAGKVWRDHVIALLKLQGTIGELIEQRSKLKRKLTISVSKPLSTFDRLDVWLKFNKRLLSPYVILARNEKKSVYGDNPYRFKLNKLPVPEGAHQLTVEAFDVHDAVRSYLDLAPDTRAAFLPKGNEKAKWRGYEREGVKSEYHKLTFQAPNFEIVDKKDAGYRPGNKLTIRYSLTGSLPYQFIALTVEPGQGKPALKIVGESKGDVQIRAPAKSGNYQIIARPAGGPTPIAKLDFRVIAPPPTKVRAIYNGKNQTSAEITIGTGNQ